MWYKNKTKIGHLGKSKIQEVWKWNGFGERKEIQTFTFTHKGKCDGYLAGVIHKVKTKQNTVCTFIQSVEKIMWIHIMIQEWYNATMVRYDFLHVHNTVCWGTYLCNIGQVAKSWSFMQIKPLHWFNYLEYSPVQLWNMNARLLDSLMV